MPLRLLPRHFYLMDWNLPPALFADSIVETYSDVPYDL
jgi:hypothetical protein